MYWFRTFLPPMNNLKIVVKPNGWWWIIWDVTNGHGKDVPLTDGGADFYDHVLKLHQVGDDIEFRMLRHEWQEQCLKKTYKDAAIQPVGPVNAPALNDLVADVDIEMRWSSDNYTREF